MSYAVIQDVAASWEQYERIAALMRESPPAGLILHVAGPTDEGFRTIDVWESQDASRRFQTKLAQAVATFDSSAGPLPILRDLRVQHAVVGDWGAAKRGGRRRVGNAGLKAGLDHRNEGGRKQ